MKERKEDRGRPSDDGASLHTIGGALEAVGAEVHEDSDITD